jgi:hypothetical protein
MRPFDRAVVELDRKGTLELRYRVSGSQPRGLLLAARIVHLLGALVLAVALVAIQQWVLPHPSPAVRWQAVQVVQTVHFLWPPFLLAGLALSRSHTVRRFANDTLAGFLGNLRYLPKSTSSAR